MDCLPNNPLLEFNKDTLVAVRTMYNLNNSVRIKESIDLLEDWVQKQNHFLKKNFNRGYLERMLVAAKGSPERTKERLDRACTLRTLMPHFFEDIDVKNDFKDNFGKLMPTVLPKLTKDHDRVFLLNHLGKGFTTKMFLDEYKFCVMLAEYIRAHDYANAYHLIIDYRDPNVVEILAKFSIIDLRQISVIIIEGYGVRVKGVHIMSDSKFMNILLSIAKQIVPSKLSGRVHLHTTLESLHKHVSKDVLPLEYGGTDRPLAELHDNWIETLSSKEFREYWRDMIAARTDESKRQSDKFNDQYMGMPGSFRTLNVD